MVQEERSLMDVIQRRKKNWIGNILRGESPLRKVIEGRKIGKRPRGRKRLGMLNEFLKESSYAELKIKAENRKERRIWKPRTCLTAEHKRRCFTMFYQICDALERPVIEIYMSAEKIRPPAEQATLPGTSLTQAVMSYLKNQFLLIKPFNCISHIMRLMQ